MPEPPYPAYTFTGADLSSDGRVGIVLEDHYWNDSDAAVVFKRFDRETGDERYVYHGNDGTSFPWNDTAQLDFLSAGVREQVIRTILDVARRFPIIRFDAAMVLAKKHVERLWWPQPGRRRRDPVARRARHDQGRVRRPDARRVLARGRRSRGGRGPRHAAAGRGVLDARGLLRPDARACIASTTARSCTCSATRTAPGYRQVMRDTLEFDPEILKRYVNFMSNPDEETALEQFGKGDKYFGVATVMATLPGLPMLGHGQVEGFGEKYGMEFRRATLDEQPDPWLVQRHEREIFPLLHRRAWFAEAHDFLLYDFVTDGGGVDEHVLAYSNGSGPQRSLVLYHDRFATTAGAIRDSASYARQGRRRLPSGWSGARSPRVSGCPNDPAAFVAFRDARTGLEYLRSCRELWERGLRLTLQAYGGHVFWEFREVWDGVAGQWASLAARLDGAGVPSLDDAFRELQLEPVHGPLRAIFADGQVRGRPRRRGATRPRLEDLERRFAAFLAAVAEATGVTGDPAALAAATIRVAPGADHRRAIADRRPGPARPRGAARLAGPVAHGRAGTRRRRGGHEPRLVRRAAPAGRPGRRPARGRARRGRRLGRADLVRVLLALPRPSALRGAARTADARLIEQWLARDPVRTAIGLNTWEGVEYLDRDRFVAMLRWAVRLDAIETGHASRRAGSPAVHAGRTSSSACPRPPPRPPATASTASWPDSPLRPRANRRSGPPGAPRS